MEEEKRKKQTFREFMEDYEGFDWKKGQIVFVERSNGAHFIIWSFGGPWEVMAQAHFDKPVIQWKHTTEVMVVTLDF